MGLSVGDGGMDIREDADLSGGDDGGAFGGGEARWWVRYRFPRVCGELWEDFPNSLPFIFNFCLEVFLVSVERRSGKYGKHFEVWGSLRLDGYLSERLLYILEMVVEARWRRGNEGMLMGCGIFGL